MQREYHKWFSLSLHRDMELLLFGHAGLPVIVFPSSQGRFYEFEERGMVGCIGDKVDRGEVQLFCVDSVDSESWYNRNVPPRWRIARQVQYQDYVMNEVVPLVRQRNWSPHLATLGCSFGGYHAVNLALKHPDRITGCLSMSGAFDIAFFLHGYHDEDVYFNMPPQYVANMGEGWHMDHYRRNTYVFGTGWDDQCLQQNRHLAGIMQAKGIPARLEIWSDWNSHDWPTWQKMMQQFL